MKFYDAHNHLQDDRFGGRQSELLAACAQSGVARMVVNGACEADWPQVLTLARQFGGAIASGAATVPASRTQVVPSFGYHPWYLNERTPDWLANLERYLDAVPGAVGEIGLDRWKPGLSYDGQEEVFLAQLRLAAERNLPASIHCLQAWGRLLELLQENSRPPCGFVLHSFGGSAEMIPAFARLGAYFSFPGYFLQERKRKQCETFRQVSSNRLLVETDAPDQPLPAERILFPLADQAGKSLNHPANLPAVYSGLAEFLEERPESLAARVEENFLRIFGGI